MKEGTLIKRTNADDPDFQQLVALLDYELWQELKEDQATYDQYNKVPGLNTVIVIYDNEKPVASGCFKKYDEDTVEIKRMYVLKEYRGKKYSKMVLTALEEWAFEQGYKSAILETSIHFKPACSLYLKTGYTVIKNYDQYIGLKDSVCMKKELSSLKEPSEFKKLKGIEYFDFEEDFVEQNIRCIPMIVRFKMDAAGIKLKLSEWSKFKTEERIELALKSCITPEDIREYNLYLAGLIKKYTQHEATALPINQKPEWAELTKVPTMLEEKIQRQGLGITVDQWKGLSDLQRFALLKLCREGHEHKNFPKAMKEFRLIQAN
jgi:hypothetical protein